MAHVGIGACACGGAPYGFGTPATSPTPGGAIYRNTLTGDMMGAALIDSHTKQYSIDSNGRVLGVSPVHQLVYLALNTLRNSSVIQDFGLDLPRVKDIADNHLQAVEGLVRDALSDLVRRNLIQIRRVGVRLFNPTGTLIELEWLDLTTGQTETTPIT
jgi:hypothetical protein